MSEIQVNCLLTSSLPSQKIFQCTYYVIDIDAFQRSPPPHHNRFTALFLGPPGRAGARRELLDFMVQGKINRGRNTDHPAGRHSIRTNHPHFLQAGCPSCRPTNSVKALKASIPKISRNRKLHKDEKYCKILLR